MRIFESDSFGPANDTLFALVADLIFYFNDEIGF